MVDFFGTVIEPSDAVVIARGNPGKGASRARLGLFTAFSSNKSSRGFVFRDEEGKACLTADSGNVISMKSVLASSAVKQ